MTEATTEPALFTKTLQVSRRSASGPQLIAEDMNLRVMPGESIAIVGESGSGKSVTARAILGLLPKNLTAEGKVSIAGSQFQEMSTAERQAARGSKVAFIMQDPFTMLNPVVKVGAQVTAALRDHRGRRLSKVALQREAVSRLAEVGINDPAVVDKYPFQLSGGMRQRVAIAAAVAENPSVLIADEPTTALDVTTQKEVLQLLDRLRRDHDMGLVLITHDLRVAFSTCDRVYVMYAGQIVEEATCRDLKGSPHHPYTSALVKADPPLEHRVDRLTSIPGGVPQPGHRPTGCRFAPRCEFAQEACREAPVALSESGAGRRTRCIRPEIAPLLRAAPVAEWHGIDAGAHAAGETLVSLRAARKVYGAKVALEGVDVDVLAGESVGIVGESGSGKTTLARMIVGLTAPTSGTVEVGGVDLASKISRRDMAVVRSTVQMAFQDPYSTLNPNRTIGSALRDGLRLAGEKKLESGAGELLDLVGLPADYSRRQPAQLSGGERQRVAIARALSRRPKALVCDEVVSALDVSVQANILNLLRDLQADLGLALLFITHDLAVVRQITDRVYVLNTGEVVEEGPTGGVLGNPQHTYTKQLISSIPDADSRAAIVKP